MKLDEALNLVHLGDCLEFMRHLPDDCIDVIITDPPYGMGTKEPTPEQIEAYLAGTSSIDTGGDFMGYEWEIPSVEVWRQCLRILKPGHHALSFASTRTWDIMKAGMQAAGFIEDDSLGHRFGPDLLAWIHSQGFPKSRDFLRHDIVPRVEGLLRAQGVEGKFDWYEWSTAASPDAVKVAEYRVEMEGNVYVIHRRDDGLFKLPPELAKWKGWGTALKPAWEPIITLRKPGPVPQGLVELDVPFRYEAKVSKSESADGLETDYGETNPHPTRKPLNLMRWLVEHSSLPGWVVLDPYCGSGTTCMAAADKGRGFVGVEIDPTFQPVAAKRSLAVKTRADDLRSQQNAFSLFMSGLDD